MDHLNPAVRFIIALAIMLLVIYLFYPILKSILALKWPKTKGKIIYSCVDTKEDDAGDGHHYLPKIEYSYTVQNKKYISQQYAFGLWFSSRKFIADKIVRKFPEQKEVVISYNPKKHQDSVLMTGLQLFHVAQIILVAAVLYLLPYK